MSTLPLSTFWDTSKTEGEANSGWFQKMLSVTKELPGAAETIPELTIATGSITPVSSANRVDTESDASTDDLSNIAVTNTPEGRRILLRAEDATRTIVLQHEAGGSGQISLSGGVDYSLDDTIKWIELILYGTTWYEVSRSGVGSSRIFLSETIASAATSIEFTDLSSDFTNYVIVLQGVRASQDCLLNLRTSFTNGAPYDSGGSDYAYSISDLRTTSLSVGGSTSTSVISLVSLSNVYAVSLSNGVSGEITIYNPSSTSYYTSTKSELSCISTASNTTALYTSVGDRNSTTAVNAVQIYPSSGNMTGILKLYGVK